MGREIETILTIVEEKPIGNLLKQRMALSDWLRWLIVSAGRQAKRIKEALNCQ